MLQAFIDASEDPDSGLQVLAGVIFKDDALHRFKESWKEALGKYHIDKFVSREATDWSEERQKEVIGYLYTLIHEYALITYAFRVDIPEMHRIFSGTFSNLLNKLISRKSDFAVRNTLAHLVTIVQDGKREHGCDILSVTFNEHLDEGDVLSDFEDFITNAPPFAKEILPNKPRFIDDEVSIPLQAADLFAWWMRVQVLENRNGLARRPRPWDGKPQLRMSRNEWDEARLNEYREITLRRGD